MKNKKLFYGTLIAIFIIGIALLTTLNRQTSSTVFIESISPSSGPIGTAVVIGGLGFTPTDNDITFTHPQINFQGDNTGYLGGIVSTDGKTLRFNLPDNDNVLLSACAYSQMKEDEACPDIGLMLPEGNVQISVVNKKGKSNSVTFIVR